MQETVASIVGVSPMPMLQGKDGKRKAVVFAKAIRYDHKSPNPMTRWSDIVKLK